MNYELHCADCCVYLLTLPEDSVDAVVTDPPYGLEFMGKEWDKLKVSDNPSGPQSEGWHDNNGKNPFARRATPRFAGKKLGSKLDEMQEQQAWHARWAREVYRVLKPGAYLVSFGGTRTYHRLACAIEDAGFEIRDCLQWLYGQGFPKSLNVGDGRGTALKPAYEPIVLARKPFKGTLRENVLKHGTGAINIDACRIETDDNLNGGAYAEHGTDRHDGAENWRYKRLGGAGEFKQPSGRWPANVLLDEIAAEMLDEHAGYREPGASPPKKGLGTPRVFGDADRAGVAKSREQLDGGGASRFFYCAKASRAEREKGCELLPQRSSLDTVSRDPSSAGANNPRAGAGRTSILNTAEVVYTDPAWVDAALSQRLQADTDKSRRKATAGSTIQCSDGSVWSTCWCGSPSTDPYHPAISSIIETDRSSITGQRISNSSRRPHTNGCMAAVFGVKADGGNLAAYVEFQSPWKRLIGTSRKKATPSTVDADLATSIASWLTSEPENGGGQRVGARNFHPT